MPKYLLLNSWISGVKPFPTSCLPSIQLLSERENIFSGTSLKSILHAATMINNGIKEIISMDAHFDLIPWIKRLDPVHMKWSHEFESQQLFNRYLDRAV